MAEMTSAQKKAIRTLTRRANRRIERTVEKGYEGQQAALEYYVQQLTGDKKFSSATAGLSYEQAALKIKQLEKFLAARPTMIKEWKKIKKQAVSKANETLRLQGYDLTDKELAEILEQIDAKDKKDFYRAVNLVQAAKEEQASTWEGASDQIAKAIAEKATYQQAQEMALQARLKNTLLE